MKKPLKKIKHICFKSAQSPTEVFKRIKAIYINAKHEHEDVLNGDISVSPEVVFSCVKHLQELAINNIDVDTKGIAFELFMKKDFFKGDRGQFFTPRNIVWFAVNMMQPNREMLDPACGSGGFLLNAIDYVRTYAEQNYIDKLEIYNHWHKFAKDRIFGIEINEPIACLCKQNLILQDGGYTNIINTDSLDTIDRLQSFNKRFKKNYFDLILTNPPFGATVQSSQKDYLKHYILGNTKNKPRKSQRNDVLFIERCIEFLKPETGKMAIVLPDGIFNNSSLKYVRNFIMETCQILAVVSLPHYTFIPYGTGTKTSLLFVRKKGNETLGNYSIFMAIAEHVGYDATGRETPDKNDLPEIFKQYREFEQTQSVPDWKNQLFLINRDELGDGDGCLRIDPQYYKPEFIKNCYKVKNIPNKQLGKLIHFSKETSSPRALFTKKFPYIEIGGIDIKTGEIKNISEMKISCAPRRAKMVVRENDILISTTAPSRGAICLIDKRFDGYIASTGFAIARKVKDEINRNYLFYALRFDSTLKQFEQRSSGGSYPTITKDELQKALVPLPPQETQIRIVELMDRVYAFKKQNETKAKQLLNSIDGYVLEQLGIKFPKLKEEKTFIISAEEIQNNRFDVYYHKPILKQVLNCIKIGKYPVSKFKEFIVHIHNGASLKNNYVDDGIPLLRILNLKRNKINTNSIIMLPPSTKKELGNAFVKEGDILISRSGSIGKVAVVPKELDGFAFGSFMIKIEVENINKNYLCFWLNNQLFQKIIKREQIGSIQRNITIPIIKNFIIPIPPKEIQNQIAQKVQNRLQRAKKFKHQAAQSLEKAKQEVEDILFKT